MIESKVGIPKIVPRQEWQRELNDLRIAEKRLTREQDALSARRRRLPMTKIETNYLFDTPEGEKSLLTLFDGRRQLIIYHFMYHKLDDRFCEGCSFFADQIGHLAHLHARNTSFAMVSRAPLDRISEHKTRMGWTMPWVSSLESDFNFDFGVSSDDQEKFGLSVFFRDGDDIYRSYFTEKRGIESLGNTWSLLDLTPWGRQETWEDSPDHWPQSEPYKWWRFHDEYGKDVGEEYAHHDDLSAEEQRSFIP